MRIGQVALAFILLVASLPLASSATIITRASGDAEMRSLALAQGWTGTGAPSDPILVTGFHGALWFEHLTLSLRIENMTADIGSDRHNACLVLLDDADVIVVTPSLRGGLEGMYAEDLGRFELHGGTLASASGSAVSLTGGQTHPAGTFLVEGATATGSHVGFDLDHDGSGSLTLRNVTATSNDFGVRADVFSSAARVSVSDSLIVGSRTVGIDVNAERPRVERNTVEGGTWGIDIAGDGAFVSNNAIRNATSIGLSLAGTNALIERNEIDTSDHGLSIGGSFNVTADANTIVGDRIGISIANANGILAYDNLVWSTQQNGEVLNAQVTWNVRPRAGVNILGGAIVAGNAWSDNAPFDPDGDGVSNTAYLPLRPQVRALGPVAGAPPTFDFAPLAWSAPFPSHR